MPQFAIAAAVAIAVGMHLRGGAAAAKATKAQGEAAANQTIAQANYNKQAYEFDEKQAKINAQIYEENAKRIEVSTAEDAKAIEAATSFQYRRLQNEQAARISQARVAYAKSGVVLDDDSTPMIAISEQTRQDSLNLFAAWDSGMTQRRQVLEEGASKAYQQRQGAQQQLTTAKFKQFQIMAEGPLAVFKAQSQTAAAAAGAEAARAGGVAAGTGSLLIGTTSYHAATNYGSSPGAGGGAGAGTSRGTA